MAARFNTGHPLFPGGLLLLLAALFSLSNLLQPVDRLIYDSIIRHAGTPPPGDIVIVSIDQKSLDKLGRWPWRRINHARLLEQLTTAKPKAVTFDVIFAEPDNLHPQDDKALAAAMRANGKVVLPVLLEEGSAGLSLRETRPLPIIADAAAALGHVDAEIDADGLVRSVFLMAGLDKPHLPALALAMARTAKANIPTLVPGERASSPSIPGHTVWRRDYRILIPFSGPAGHIHQISYVDVLAGKVSPEEFTDHFVLVGVTATGLGDHIPTPVSALSRPLPGVEFNAHVLNSLLRNNAIVETPSVNQLVWNLGITLGLVFLFYKLRHRFLLGTLFAGLFIITAGSIILLTKFNNWYPPATLLIILISGFGLFNWGHLNRVMRKLFMARLDSQTTVNTASEGIVKTTDEGVIIDINESAEQLLGLDSSEARGRYFSEVVKLKKDDNSPRLQINELFSEQFQQIGKRLTLSNWHGKTIPVRLNYTVVPVPRGEAKRNILILSDLRREEQLESELEHQSRHNSLTSLPNRSLFQRKLEEKIKHAQLASTQLAVLQVNLDEFRQINQTFGNEQGDQVIKTIAKRLHQLSGYYAALAHPGADEFLIVVEGILVQRLVTSLVKQLQNSIAEPIDIAGKEMSLSACIGISLFPDDNVRADLLIRQADIAVQRAKELGAHNDVVFFSQGMQIQTDRKVEIHQLIQECLVSKQIVTLYQPIVRAEDGQIVAIEALMRILDHDGNHVSPIEFIPVAEKSGLIVDLGKLQMQQACQHIMLWHQMNIPVIRLSLNLSPRQLLNTELVTEVKEIISSTNFPPTEIEFEITENLLLEQEDHIFSLFAEFQQLGVTFALDDFGTGYNSMIYLRSGSFDRLKIDMSFVRDLGTTPGANVITASIIDMAHSLGMKVIAEGIETEEQRDILCSQGCDELQGFYFSEPLPMDAFFEYYQRSGGAT